MFASRCRALGMRTYGLKAAFPVEVDAHFRKRLDNKHTKYTSKINLMLQWFALFDQLKTEGSECRQRIGR